MKNINPYDKTHIDALFNYLFIRIFSNKYLINFSNLVLTAIITLFVSKGYLFQEGTKYKFIICVLLQILINILSIIADKVKNDSEQSYIYLNDAYNIQSRVNNKTAANLYRVNKKIINIVKDMKCEKGACFAPTACTTHLWHSQMQSIVHLWLHHYRKMKITRLKEISLWDIICGMMNQNIYIKSHRKYACQKNLLEKTRV